VEQPEQDKVAMVVPAEILHLALLYLLLMVEEQVTEVTELKGNTVAQGDLQQLILRQLELQVQEQPEHQKAFITQALGAILLVGLALDHLLEQPMVAEEMEVGLMPLTLLGVLAAVLVDI
jgi:hypothetical protein